MYLYSAFGLKIRSEIELPEMHSSLPFEEYEIEINLGKCPNVLQETEVIDSYFYANKREFLMIVENIGSFYVTANEIRIEPKTNDLSIIRLYLLGSTFTALLYLRSILPIHAGVFIYKNRAVAISGESGSGKSTTIAHFARKGYKVLSDDVCAVNVQINSNSAIVFPSYPQIKLHQDALVDLGEKYLHLPRVSDERRKYILLSEKFENVAHQLKCIYCLSYTKQPNTLKIMRLKGHDKYTAILRSTHRIEMMNAFRKQKWYLELCHWIGKNIEVREVIHSYDMNKMNSLLSLVEKDLETY